MVRLLAVVALVAACSRDVSIANGVCGNWVLDPGEDCDRPGGACTTTCRIVCDPDAPTACSAADAVDGTCCPSGMACGRDDVCHAPTGTLAASAIAVPFEVSSVRTGDIDGDHLDDLIGGGADAIELRYGDPSTPLARETTTLAPALFQNAELGFGDLDGDGRPDIAIPTAGGLFAFEETTGAPTPVEFPADVAQGRVHERLAYLGSAPLLGFLLEYDLVPGHAADASKFQLTVLQTPSITSKEVYEPYDTQPSLCGITTDLPLTAAVRGRALHPYLDGATARLPLVLGSTSVGICVVTLNPTQGGAPSYAIPKSVFGSHVPVEGDGETFFANLLSSSGCPDLVVPTRDAGGNYTTMILRGVGTTGACQVDPLGLDARFVAGLPLAAIAYAPLADPTTTFPALITSVGVYSLPGATLVDAATRDWRYAVVADLDGDGRQDFAAAAKGTDVEVFRQVPGLQFSDFVIPTSGTVERIALGNFDGDKAGDVAFATSDPDTAAASELSVAWGDSDGTFTTADIGPIDSLDDVIRAQLQDPGLPPLLDQNDDLVVARAGGDGTDPANPTRLVDEYGSTARVFTAPFVYTSTFSDPGGPSTTPYRGVGIGAEIAAFDGPTPQVLAMFADDPSAHTPYNTALVELTRGSDGNFTKTAEALTSLCAPAADDDTPFCWSTARWLTMGHPGGGALLLGLRSDPVGGARSQCAEYYLGGRGSLGLTPLSCAALAPAAAGASDPDTQAAYGALTGVAAVHVLDDDGTTQHELVTSGAFHAERSFLWALTIGAAGQPQLAAPLALDSELARAGVLPAGTAASCMDAVEVELGTRDVAGTTYGANAPELVVACSVSEATGADTQLWARYAGPGGGAPHYELLRDLHGDLEVRLRSGDFDGNGLGDVEYSFRDPAGKHEAVLGLQCDAHQAGCQEGS